MKIRPTFFWAFLFFIVVNTSYLWEVYLGFFGIIVFGLLMVGMVVFAILLLFHTFRLVQEKGAKFKRLLLVVFLSFVLFSTYHRPGGLIDFNQFEGKDVYEAHREGGGNCQMRLRLKETGKFIYKTHCFSVDEHRGYYEVRKDTVFFKTKEGEFIDDFYQFGVIRKHIRSNGGEGSTVHLYNKKNVENKFKNILVTLKNELPITSNSVD